MHGLGGRRREPGLSYRRSPPLTALIPMLISVSIRPLPYLRRTTALVGASVLVAACAPATAATPTASAPTPVSAPSRGAATLTSDVHWARNSAEHRAIYLEVYRMAADRLPALVATRRDGTWGVILDADETVLDNSEYEVSRVPFGGTYDPAAWTAWVLQGRAPALPGAPQFTARVHELGGKVVIVTNRTEAECAATRTNLAQVAIVADLVLCRGATGDKNPRFQAVQSGTAQAGFPAIAVLEWIGDNIEDFPALKQTVRTLPDSAFSHFGNDYFALPNAMYGSWQSNPKQ